MTGYVCITFDDDGADRYTYAYSILHARNIPATFFIYTNGIGGNGQLTAAQLLEMEAGGCEIGSHTVSHTQLPTLTAEQYTAELTNSKAALEALGLTINSFAYPGYAYNLAIAAVAKGIYRWQRVGTTYFIDFAHLTAGTTMVASYSDAEALASLDMVKKGIDRAIANDSVVIFTIHNTLSDGRLEDNPATNLNDVADYIAAKVASGDLQALRIRDLSNLVSTDNVYEWTASAAGNLSDGTKWDKGTAPGAGNHIVLSGASSQNMTIDTAAVYGDITIGLEYAGTVTKNNVTIGYGDWRQQGASSTYTPNSTPYETCSKNHNKSGGTMTTDVLRLIMTGDGVYMLSNTNSGYHSLDINGNVVWESPYSITVNYNFWLREGKKFNLSKLGAGFAYKSYNGGTYQNLGEIDGLATFKYLVYNAAAPTWNPGIIRCPVTITNFGAGPTVNVTVKLTGKLQPSKAILVYSTNATYGITLDTQGYAISHGGLSLANAKSGLVLGASRVTGSGNLDTSAGTVDFGTSTVVQTGGTIKTSGAAQPLYNLEAPVAPANLASDVTVSNTYRHLRDAVLNGHVLTYDPAKEVRMMEDMTRLGGSRSRTVALLGGVL